jgi:uroporphyrinogen decarboxylase
LSRADRFLKACRLQEVDATPIWMMRQAGRYMKEYREIRKRHGFLEMCRNPEIAAEVTLQPVEHIGVDAAILFADILLPLPGMGIRLEFAAGEGPVIGNPVRTAADVAKLRRIVPEEDTPYVLEAVRIVKRELAGKVPLIGFSGAPYTLASYIIEGGGSKNYVNTKTMMYSDPKTWHALMELLADVVVDYLNAQVKAGAQAVQVFDSWVGSLSPSDYNEYVLPHSKSVFERLDDSVPSIHFANQGSTLLESVKAGGGDLLGLDWRTDLDVAWSRLGGDVGVQGNLDPVVLYAPIDVIERKAAEILAKAGGRPGHVFNLGHGILPTTPVEHAQALVEIVHRLSARPGAGGAGSSTAGAPPKTGSEV